MARLVRACPHGHASSDLPAPLPSPVAITVLRGAVGGRARHSPHGGAGRAGRAIARSANGARPARDSNGASRPMGALGGRERGGAVRAAVTVARRGGCSPQRRAARARAPLPPLRGTASGPARRGRPPGNGNGGARGPGYSHLLLPSPQLFLGGFPGGKRSGRSPRPRSGLAPGGRPGGAGPSFGDPEAARPSAPALFGPAVTGSEREQAAERRRGPSLPPRRRPRARPRAGRARGAGPPPARGAFLSTPPRRSGLLPPPLRSRGFRQKASLKGTSSVLSPSVDGLLVLPRGFFLCLVLVVKLSWLG